MKKIYYEFIIFIIVFLLIFIKDELNYNTNNQNVISLAYSYVLNSSMNDYQELKNINHLSYQLGVKCITRISYHNLSDFNSYDLVLNKDGCNIKKGDIVLNEQGLYGIVMKVSKRRVIVNNIRNYNDSLSIIVNNQYGTMKCLNGKCIINDIDTSLVNLNEKIYTSGLTEIPRDILIGSVNKIINNEIIVKLNHCDNYYVAILGVDYD